MGKYDNGCKRMLFSKRHVQVDHQRFAINGLVDAIFFDGSYFFALKFKGVEDREANQLDEGLTGCQQEQQRRTNKD